MKVSYRHFNMIAVALAALAVLMLPFWPYSRWGYFPTGLLVVMVMVMFALRRLARN